MLLKQEQHHNHLPFQINRPGALAQMKVVEAMSEGPRAQKTAQLQALMPNNPPVQKAADEEEVQMKAKPVQKAGRRGRSANESRTRPKKGK